eukprot:15188243-Alexandrium_andersonii.AAC.1
MVNRESDFWAWPEFKGKAANTRHVCQWLSYELEHAVGTPIAERALFWGLSQVLHVLRDTVGQVLSEEVAEATYSAGRAALLSYGELSKGAALAQL